MSVALWWGLIWGLYFDPLMKRGVKRVVCAGQAGYLALYKSPMLGLKLGVLTEPEGLCVCGVAFVMVRVGGESCRSPPHGRIGGVSLVCGWVCVCVCVCVFVRVCLFSVCVFSCVSDASRLEGTEALIV